MEHGMQCGRGEQRLALRPQRTFIIVTGYVVLSALWIAATNCLVPRIVEDATTAWWLSIVTGELFVVGTALLLLVHLRRERRARAAHETRLREQATVLNAAAAQLQDSEERYRVLFEMESDALFLIDNEAGQILEVNPAASALYGYTRAELLAKRNVDLSAEPEDTRAATQTHRPRVPVRHHRKQDGTVFPVEIAARHFLWQGREAHIAAIRDITERERADAVLARRTRQLEALRTVTEEITRERDLPTVLRLIHTRAMELIGGDSGAVYLWDEVTQVAIPQSWQGFDAWMADVRIRPGDGVTGTVLARRQGMLVNSFRTSPYATPFWLERSPHVAVLGEPLLYGDRLVGAITVTRNDPACPFQDDDQRLLQFFAAPAAIAIENARRIAQLTRTAEDLQRAQGELVRTETLRALGQMAAGVAHDLNNILATVLGQTELVRARVADPTARESLQLLETAATDGVHVVRRLQDFARQRPSAPATPVDLAAAVRDAVELTRPRWETEPQRQGRVIEVDTQVIDLPPILGHAAEVREVLTNLITNAVDAMPEGGRLSLVGVADPDGVRLAIADTGTGMSDTVQRRIFEPFFTTKGSHGTGLGLAVVYAIMERHHGRIHVDSTPDCGTVVTLRFPAAISYQPAPPPAPAPAPASLAPQRLLLIDDEAPVRRTIAALLGGRGHTVIEADGGAAGLEVLAATPVDAVVTDLGMPGLTGWDVARAVKARAPDLPVLLLTGWGEEVAREGQPADSIVDRILPKPFHIEAFLAALAAVHAGRAKAT